MLTRVLLQLGYSESTTARLQLGHNDRFPNRLQLGYSSATTARLQQIVEARDDIHMT